MLCISLQRVAQRDSPVKNKQRSPAGFPTGLFVKMPELSDHFHATSARAAGTASAAAFVTG
jgi:hypothetical protein